MARICAEQICNPRWIYTKHISTVQNSIPTQDFQMDSIRSKLVLSLSRGLNGEKRGPEGPTGVLLAMHGLTKTSLERWMPGYAAEELSHG
jgi:hypothetical protein